MAQFDKLPEEIIAQIAELLIGDTKALGRLSRCSSSSIESRKPYYTTMS
jgi:hypothetical protein